MLTQANPRQVLEDLVRALEAREAQLDDLVTAARQAQDTLEAFKALAANVLQQFGRSGAPGSLRTQIGPRRNCAEARETLPAVREVETAGHYA